MAEMTTLVSAIYRKYTTSTTGGFDNISPGITGRYEVFYDESCKGMRVSLFYHLYGTMLTRSRNMNAESSSNLRLLQVVHNATYYWLQTGPIRITKICIYQILLRYR